MAAGKPFEVVFVSGDNSEEEFEDCFKTMPWLAIPFGDSRIEYLNSRFEVEGIPSLVLVDDKGEALRKDLRSIVTSDPNGDEFPWPRKTLNTLAGTLETINDVPTVVVFTDGSSAQIDAAKAALKVSSISNWPTYLPAPSVFCSLLFRHFPTVSCLSFSHPPACERS